MKNKIIIAALAGIMLSSCGAYKKYQPVTAVDENLYGIESPGLDTTSIANIDWREMITDKYLQSLIDSALVNNTEYQ